MFYTIEGFYSSATRLILHYKIDIHGDIGIFIVNYTFSAPLDRYSDVIASYYTRYLRRANKCRKRRWKNR